jgi:hypothetical protein
MATRFVEKADFLCLILMPMQSLPLPNGENAVPTRWSGSAPFGNVVAQSIAAIKPGTPVWKKEDSFGQPTPTLAMYSQAVDTFVQSATAFMEHVHFLNEAREAYEEAMRASAALRDQLDAGDHTLRTFWARLASLVSNHLQDPTLDSGKPELRKGSNGGRGLP